MKENQKQSVKEDLWYENRRLKDENGLLSKENEVLKKKLLDI